MSLTVHPNVPSLYFDASEIIIGGFNVGVFQEGQNRSPVELAGLAIEEVVSPVLQQSHIDFQVALAMYAKKLELSLETERVVEDFYTQHFRPREEFQFGIFDFSRLFERFFQMKFIDEPTLKDKVAFTRKLWVIEVSRKERKRLKKLKAAIESEYSVVLEAIKTHPNEAAELIKAKTQLEKARERLFTHK